MAALERLDAALFAAVVADDVPALLRLRLAHGAGAWSRCFADPQAEYANNGTVLHWAVWLQHFDVVRLVRASGADAQAAFDVVGTGNWMGGKTASAYAAFLDQQAGHPYYDHVNEFRAAFEGRPSASDAEGDAAGPPAELALALLVQRHLEARAPFAVGAPLSASSSLDEPEVRVVLHDLVELHCIAGLEAVHARFGAALAAVPVGPRNNIYRNFGTLGHWAVWYRHWAVLRWLADHGCVDMHIRSQGGGWLRGVTLLEYSQLLDDRCSHPYYEHVRRASEALAEVSPTARPPQAVVDRGGRAAAPAADAAADLERLRERELEVRVLAVFAQSMTAFRVHGLLGAGAEGIVLDVSCTPGAVPGLPVPLRRYALKVSYNLGIGTDLAVDAFATEFRVMVPLPSHPNVVRFLCRFFGQPNQDVLRLMDPVFREAFVQRPVNEPQRVRSTQFYLVERVADTLQGVLAPFFAAGAGGGAPRSPPKALAQRVLCDVGAALLHLEACCVCHLDVKPNNVLVERGAGGEIVRCVLADFGVALRVDDAVHRTASLHVDAQGRSARPPWGNAEHAAPELHNAWAAGIRRRAATDVAIPLRGQPAFELAVLAHQVLRNAHPLQDYPGAFTDMATGLIAFGAVDVCPLPDVAAGIADAVRRACAFESGERFSLQQLVTALREW